MFQTYSFQIQPIYIQRNRTLVLIYIQDIQFSSSIQFFVLLHKMKIYTERKHGSKILLEIVFWSFLKYPVFVMYFFFGKSVKILFMHKYLILKHRYICKTQVRCQWLDKEPTILFLQSQFQHFANNSNIRIYSFNLNFIQFCPTYCL